MMTRGFMLSVDRKRCQEVVVSSNRSAAMLICDDPLLDMEAVFINFFFCYYF